MALAGISRTTQIFRIYRFSKLYLNLLTERSIKFTPSASSFNIQCQKFFSNDQRQKVLGKKDESTSPEGQKKRKPLRSPHILLIMSENDVSTVTLEEAERLAKARKLKLVQVVDFDTKSEKPVYKLMTALEYFEEEIKVKEEKKKDKNSAMKEQKLFTLSTKICENDLLIKIGKIFKLLKKRHTIKIFISIDGNPTKADEIFSTLEKELKEVTQKIEKQQTRTSYKLKIIPKIEGEDIVHDSESKNETPKTEKQEKKVND